MNITANNYNSIANHNLSSVLSQIQDNGPAYADSSKDLYRNQASQKSMNHDTATSKPSTDELCEDTVSLSSNGEASAQNPVANLSSVKKRNKPWCLATIAVVINFSGFVSVNSVQARCTNQHH